MTPTEIRDRIPVAVMGATGSVGQRFVQLLVDHPWFELRAVCASAHKVGRTYGEAVQWLGAEPLPPEIAELRLGPVSPPPDAELVFSALPPEVAGPVEVECAEAGRLVVSNAASHRMDAGVPLVIPEVNPDHLELLGRRGPGGGGIITNPNCSTIGLVLALAPIARAYGVKRAHVVTLQALSGAGLPGVSAMHVIDNVLPFIRGEEDKLEVETRKILGRLADDRLVESDLAVSAQCNRVPVLDGHMLCVSVELEREAQADELVAIWNAFRGEPQERGLPSAPARPTIYLEDEDAPQPRLHRDLERGMATVIGRLRPCSALDWRFVALSHNTLRGAAGGAVLLAELALARGLLAGV